MTCILTVYEQEYMDHNPQVKVMDLHASSVIPRLSVFFQRYTIRDIYTRYVLDIPPSYDFPGVSMTFSPQTCLT